LADEGDDHADYYRITQDQGGLAFQTYDGNFDTDVYFASGGNVGIATASPAQKLDLGSGRFRMATNEWIEFGGDQSVIYGTQSSGTFTVRTGGSDHMTVTSAGKVGIGTASPDRQLHIYANAAEAALTLQNDAQKFKIGIYDFGSGDDNLFIYAHDVGTEAFVIEGSTGNVGIGTALTSPYRDLNVMNAATGETWIRFGSNYSNGQTVGLEFVAGGNGPTGSGFVQASQYLVGSGSSSSQVMNFKLVDNSSIKLWLNNGGFNGTHASTSDVALKENIADLSDGTTMLKALRPRTFDWRTDKEHAGVGTGQTGFIAQEVEAVSDKLINGLEGTKGIYTMGLLTLAIKTIQELEARITTLEG
jgi:hypothetical protein